MIVDERLRIILSRLKGVKRSHNGYTGLCPAHDDQCASLSINEGKGGRILIKCHVGCSAENVVAALGLTMQDLFPGQEDRQSKPHIVAIYDYVDEHGGLLFQTVRYHPKNFKQRRPDPDQPGRWIYNVKNVPRVLYRLQGLKTAIASGQTVYVAEGEKDVDDLVKHGFAATCNPFGAKLNGSTWRPEHTCTLRQASSVVVIADKDETGRCHARVVASALRDVLRSVKVTELPDKGTVRVKDSHDFFNAGGTANELKAIIDAAPEFAPTTKPKSAKSDSAGRKSAATELVKLADEFAFFHDPQDRPFVRLEISGHTEIWPVESSKFRKLLAGMFYKRIERTINRNALTDAITTLAGRACHDAPEEPIFLRVAPYGENILIDLCDPEWRVIEVTAAGWRVLQESPVAFIRTSSMRPLPEPGREGSIGPLWKLLNVTPAQRPLVASTLLNYFHPAGPYFVLIFVGEQGTAKSCAGKIVRIVVDPNKNPMRSPPREERDLIAQAANNWCVSFDNLSMLPAWLSDGLCRLSTGGGHSARQLYTDLEEFSLDVKRPVILNGIEDVATRPDLAERALQIELERIPDDRRITEKKLWLDFEAVRPTIFAGILNGLVCALRELPNVDVDSLPRMADAALWATAGETAFGWERGTFIAAYRKNLDEGAIASVEAHPVGLAILKLLENQDEWSGEPAQLFDTLNSLVSDEQRRVRAWPGNARSLSSYLRRLAPAFRRAGIEIVHPTRGKRRLIKLCKTGNFASPASSGNPESEMNNANDANLQPLHDENKTVRELVEQEMLLL